MSTSQSQATINCIINLCTEKGYKHTPNETVYSEILTKEDLTNVVNFITAGLVEGSISITDKSKEKWKVGTDQVDVKGLRRYVVGLVNDRLRKAKALNGNVKYEYKEPGKLTMSKDPELKALNQTMEITTDPEHKKLIQVEIDRRQQELNKPKKVEVDVSLLPKHLRDKLGL